MEDRATPATLRPHQHSTTFMYFSTLSCIHYFVALHFHLGLLCPIPVLCYLLPLGEDSSQLAGCLEAGINGNPPSHLILLYLSCYPHIAYSLYPAIHIAHCTLLPSQILDCIQFKIVTGQEILQLKFPTKLQVEYELHLLLCCKNSMFM